MSLAAVLQALERRGPVKRVGKEYKGLCSAHPDTDASLDVCENEDGRIFAICRSRGCAFEDIVKGLGVPMSEFLPPKKSTEPARGTKYTPFSFRDEQGIEVSQSVRVDRTDGKKTFFQRHRGPNGEWINNTKGVRRVVYGLPELKAADPSEPVWVVGGEKCVHIMRDHGFVATTNIGGEGHWVAADSEFLRDLHVVVFPDADEVGHKHGQQVAASLQGVAKSVRVVDVLGLPPKGDCEQYFGAGRTAEELRELAANTPEWTPQAEPVPTVEAIDAEVVSGGDYRFSESEAARRFGDQIRGRYLWVADEGQGYAYDGKRFSRDHGGLWLLEQSLLVSRAYAEDAIDCGSNDAHFQARLDMAKKYNGLSGRKRLMELVRAEPGIATLSAELDADPWLLNVENGTINLRTGERRDHDPADKITKLAPVTHDPGARCPRFDLFLQEVVTDPETIPWIGKAAGYSATGDCSERVAFFLYGPTTSGKSVLVETLKEILGDYAVTAPTSLLLEKRNEGHPCDRMVLKGTRVAIFSELPRGQRFDLPTFKTLTGNDTLTGRGMRENYSTFKPTAKLWMTGNHKPIVTDPDDSTWVRMRVIPIDKTIPADRVDRQLREKLLHEAPGILAWLVRGALAWQRDRLGDTARVRAATTAYKDESDRLGPFFAERCTFSPDNRVSRAALRAAYESWCEREGERPINPRDFGEQLRQRGVSDRRVKEAGESVLGWAGVGLLARGVQVDSGGQHFPDNRLRDSLTGVNPESLSTPIHLSTQDDDDGCGQADPGREFV